MHACINGEFLAFPPAPPFPSTPLSFHLSMLYFSYTLQKPAVDRARPGRVPDLFPLYSAALFCETESRLLTLSSDVCCDARWRLMVVCDRGVGAQLTDLPARALLQGTGQRRSAASDSEGTGCGGVRTVSGEVRAVRAHGQPSDLG